MLGKINFDENEVNIVGAGISGLLCAYTLQKKNFKINIYEKTDRVGGLINTTESQNGMVEWAAHSVLSNDNLKHLCQDINVNLLPVKNKQRYIFKNGKARRFPLNLTCAARLLKKLLFVKNSGNLDNLTLGQFGRKFLGDQATNNLLTPMTNGIYAADANNLSLDLTFPQLKPSENQTLFQRIRQLKKERKGEKSQMVAAENGTFEIAEKLFNHLKNKDNVSFYFNYESTELDFSKNNIITVPAYHASKLFDDELQSNLQKVNYLPLVTATIFIENAAFDKVPQGVGVLNAPSENCESLGILFNSSAFDGRTTKEDTSSFTMILGGLNNTEIINKKTEELEKIICEEAKQILKAQKNPDEIIITKWHKAIPHYSLQHQQNLQLISHKLPQNTVLFGNYTGNIGIRQMVDKAFQL